MRFFGLVFIFCLISSGSNASSNEPLDALRKACTGISLGELWMKEVTGAFDSKDADALHGRGRTLDFMLGLRTWEGANAATYEMSGRPALWSERHETGFGLWYENALEIFLTIPIKPGETFVDFGSSFGRVIAMGGALFPEAQFLGYEIVSERVRQSRRALERLNLNNVQVFEQDLSDPEFEVPKAQYYYFYDSLNHLTFAQILDKIHQRNPQALIILEEGSGEGYAVITGDRRYSKVGEIIHNGLMRASLYRAR